MHQKLVARVILLVKFETVPFVKYIIQPPLLLINVQAELTLNDFIYLHELLLQIFLFALHAHWKPDNKFMLGVFTSTHHILTCANQ